MKFGRHFTSNLQYERQEIVDFKILLLLHKIQMWKSIKQNQVQLQEDQMQKPYDSDSISRVQFCHLPKISEIKIKYFI